MEALRPVTRSTKTWLISIAHNLLIDHYRASRVRPTSSTTELAERHGSHVAGPEQDLGLSPELATALGPCRSATAEIVAFRFGGDLTGPEIAELLDLSLANVQQILSRSLRKLRVELEPQAG